jgi:curli biogenesis system outer membrane secretion channel CsgG
MKSSKQIFCILVFAGLGLAQTTQPLPTGAKKDSIESDLAAKLLNARRIYVDSFGQQEINRTLQAMVIDALRTSKLFIVTEDQGKADLILRGAALEKTSQEAHAVGSSTIVAGASGSSYGSRGISDSQASLETVNDARLAVRLVSQDGDVVWSATEESKGAKYKGATADVADLVVKSLIRELDRLRATASH